LQLCERYVRVELEWGEGVKLFVGQMLKRFIVEV